MSEADKTPVPTKTSGSRLRILSVVMLLLVAGVAGAFTLSVRNDSPALSVYAAQYELACTGDTNSSCANAIYEEAAKYYEPYDVLKALAGVPGEAAQARCHSILHDVGKNAARTGTYSRPALLSGFCNDGYMHGWVIQTAELSPEKISTEVIPLCDELFSNERSLGRACFHSVGHALYDSAKLTADESFKLCMSSLDEADCNEGVSMVVATDIFALQEGSFTKRNLSDEAFVARWAKIDCGNKPSVDSRQACVRASASNTISQQDSPRAWVVTQCEAFSDAQMRVECARGYGLGLGMRIRIDGQAAVLDSVMTFCSKLTGAQYCMSAAARQSADSGGDPAIGLEMCTHFAEPTRSLCTNEVTQWASRFGVATSSSSSN